MKAKRKIVVEVEMESDYPFSPEDIIDRFFEYKKTERIQVDGVSIAFDEVGIVSPIK